MIALSELSNKTGAVTAVSVDSASRRADQTPSDYTLELPTMVDRAVAVEVGNIYLPFDAMTAVSATTNTHIGWLEPLTIPTSATLVLQETTTTVNTDTGLIVGTTIFPALTITLPPTLNALTSVAANGVAVVTSAPHALDVVFLPTYAALGLRCSIVGGLYPANNATDTRTFGPQLSSTTIATVPTTTTFTFNAGYLDSLVAAAGFHDERNTFAAYVSYIHNDRPTLSELLVLLNAALAAKWNPANLAPTGTSLILQATFALDDAPAGSGRPSALTFAAPSLVRTSGNLRYTTTASLTAAGTANGLLGFNTGAPTLLSGASPVAIPYTRIPSVRTALLEHGTYSEADARTMVSRKLSPLDFSTWYQTDSTVITTTATTATTTVSTVTSTTVTPSAYRTVSWIDAGGVTQALLIPQGRYTGTQLATVLTGLMAAATGSSNYVCSWAQAASGDFGSFTFTQTQGQRMGLDFSGVAALNTARQLGFLPLIYGGTSSYTSPQRVASGIVLASASAPAFPDTTCMLVSSQSQRRGFSVCATPPMMAYCPGVVGAVAKQWATLSAEVAGVDVVPGGFSAGAVLVVRLGGAGPFPLNLASGSILTVVVASTWPGTGGSLAYVTLRATASIDAASAGGSGIGTPTASVIPRIVSDRRNVAQLLLSAPGSAARLLGFPARTLPTTTALAQLAPAGTEAGLATLPPGVSLSNGQVLSAPYCWDLEGPAYVLMRFLESDGENADGNVHTYGESVTHVLAKFYTRSTFQRITEEVQHVAFACRRRIRSLRVQFTNPDGTLVDFGGRDHSYTLFFVTDKKRVEQIAM